MPTRPAGPIAQDWEPVVLHKSKPKAQVLRDQKAVNQALRAGAQVQTVKKFDGGTNKKSPATAVYARKLDEAEQPAALDRVAPEVRQLIQKARIDKKLSQADLAKQINERPQVVQEYENGKAVPNQAVLAKMERVLGVKLRGKALMEDHGGYLYRSSKSNHLNRLFRLSLKSNLNGGGEGGSPVGAAAVRLAFNLQSIDPMDDNAIDELPIESTADRSESSVDANCEFDIDHIDYY
ncbi:hypothetical protein SSX86_032431 [Deinandra increscens subsp. villosa]|uniref:HTH cro/C1-type domain-containing protein n=1 Tax=Deinandra increscens subsp. villosa TaxID=3103831 RepID=A0AAP0C2X6_9ASTR